MQLNSSYKMFYSCWRRNHRSFTRIVNHSVVHGSRFSSMLSIIFRQICFAEFGYSHYTCLSLAFLKYLNIQYLENDESKQKNAQVWLFYRCYYSLSNGVSPVYLPSDLDNIFKVTSLKYYISHMVRVITKMLRVTLRWLILLQDYLAQSQGSLVKYC